MVREPSATQKVDSMDKQAIINKVNNHTKDGKISCNQAQKIAEEDDIPYKNMGALLNEPKIKITSCQLGCFP
jgi:hypothetical protein